MKARLIFVGGFLGAGKTTLLFETAKRLMTRGEKVGLITNDQASGLVDTAVLRNLSGVVQEVSGSCFCCNFDGLTDAIDSVTSINPGGMIFAEPVGSCTDLSATLLQPLKEKKSAALIVAPLTVLVDPHRAKRIVEGASSGIHRSAEYIVKKQLEEADYILINKCDLLNPQERCDLARAISDRWNQATVMCASARTGEGLDEWLEEIRSGKSSGTHLAEVDYDIYAEGEAVLGWLNESAKLTGSAVNWNGYVRNFMENLSERFRAAGSAVGHVKVLLETGDGKILANLTGGSATLSVRGTVSFDDSAALTINARVETTPNDLQRIVNEELSRANADTVSCSIEAVNCLTPGRPNPTHRYDHIVNA